MEKNFANAPTVSIGRSKFNRVSQHKTTFNLGSIVPLYVDEVLPGDTRNISVSSLIRMSTPIAPIMDDIIYEIFAFFVPHRLVWENWKEFMGESPNAGISQQTEKLIPSVAMDVASPNSIGNYMGLPIYTGSETVSLLPLRAYCLIYNRWFRNQNIQNPIYVPIDDTNTPTIPVSGVAVPITYNFPCFNACKKPDYFTSALPYAQKGDAVQIPLNGLVPVVTGDNHTIPNKTLHFYDIDAQAAATAGKYLGIGSGSDLTDGSTAFGADHGLAPDNLWANLEYNANMTVNQVRLAFATQRLLEKDALYGSRYWEILYGHFGVKSPDASLQDPEYLGGMKFYINIDQVLQTTGFNATPGSNTLGTPGANSVTGNNGQLFTKSFVEHGTLLILGVARQKVHTYSQGIERMWSRSRRLDFYFPTFANLGAQDIKAKELTIGVSGPYADDDVFGYQEAWAEYRFKSSRATSLLNPNVSGALDYWTLSDEYALQPGLGDAWITETRNNLSRCLVTGVAGPDFIADFLFDDIAVRPLPMYSIPGLIDHH